MKKILLIILFFSVSLFGYTQNNGVLTLDYIQKNFSISIQKIPTIQIQNPSNDTLNVKLYQTELDVYVFKAENTHDDTIFISTTNLSRSSYKIIIENLTRKETIKSYIDIE